jgi:hypothetical protein
MHQSTKIPGGKSPKGLKPWRNGQAAALGARSATVTRLRPAAFD